jgi:hypothetical protein
LTDPHTAAADVDVVEKRRTAGSSFRGDLGKRYRSRLGSDAVGAMTSIPSGVAELLRTGGGSRATSLRADLGRRSSFRPDLGKRQDSLTNNDNDDEDEYDEEEAEAWSDETAPDSLSDLADETDQKRARSGFRGDLGKRTSFHRRLQSVDDLHEVGDYDDEQDEEERLLTGALAKSIVKRAARNGFRGDLGKRRSSFRGDLGKRNNLQQYQQQLEEPSSSSSQLAYDGDDDGFLLFDKRRRSSLRGDLGKRRTSSSSTSSSSRFRGDLGKRRPSTFRGDLGKRRLVSTLRADLGKRNYYVDVDDADDGYAVVDRRKRQTGSSNTTAGDVTPEMSVGVHD